jgi:ABC-type protease/lipase transport system fused ATPase/permease subunit
MSNAVERSAFPVYVLDAGAVDVVAERLTPGMLIPGALGRMTAGVERPPWLEAWRRIEGAE